MSSLPRRTPQEIEELRRAHRAGYNARHNPPPTPTERKPRKKAHPIRHKGFKEYKDPSAEIRERKEKEFKDYKIGGLRFDEYAPNTSGVVRSKSKKIYDPATDTVKKERHLNFAELSANNNKKLRGFLKQKFHRNYPPPPTPPITQSARSPFFPVEKSINKKRKQGVGHGGARKKQKRI